MIDETEGGAGPSYPTPANCADNGSNIYAPFTVNDALPWMVLLAILAAMSLGFAIPAYIQSTSHPKEIREELLQDIHRSEDRAMSDSKRLSDRINISENHWRNDEVELMNLRSDVNKLQRSK